MSPRRSETMDIDPQLRDAHSPDSETSISPSPSAQLAETSPNDGGPESPDPTDQPATQLSRAHHDASGSSSVAHTPNSPQYAQAAGSSGHDFGPDGDPKRPRACEGCRRLKVRCEPDPADVEGPCKRCKKAKRKCIVTARTRTGERQKKTDSRVAELEKKIDALTASLQAHGPRAVSAAPASSQYSQTTQAAPLCSDGDGPAGHGAGRTLLDGRWAGSSDTPGSQPPLATARKKRKLSNRHNTGGDDDERTRPPLPQSNSWDPEQTDIVDRGILTMEKASELWDRYNERMVPHLPAVVFPPGMAVSELRKSKPTLFLTIMACAAAENAPLQRTLVKELTQVIAEKVVVLGEKTLELVQAINIAVIWYWPPEHFEELKFYQMVHMAAVMALDLGLGKKIHTRRKLMMNSLREHPFRKTGCENPGSIECRRTWLTCYFLAANTAIALHRPNLIRWTSFMEESVDMLQTSPEAAPTDKYLTFLVMNHQLGEEIGVQFSLDEPCIAVDIADQRTQYALRSFERALEKQRSRVPEELMLPSLKISFNTLSVYMHEIALHSPGQEVPSRHPFNAESLGGDGVVHPRTLTTGHINALSACLVAAHEIFDTFLAMDLPHIRCLPVFNFVRVAYAVVVLIKIYFAATAPDSELGLVLSKPNIRVDFYLDSLLEKFRATAAENLSRPASKFLIVLVMLRSWFMKHGKGDGASSVQPSQGSNGTQTQMQTQTARRDLAAAGEANSHPDTYKALPAAEYPSSANTPLHLLSELATGTSGAVNRPSWPGHRHTGQPFMYEPETPSTAVLGKETDTTNPPPHITLGVDASALAGTANGPMGWFSQTFNSTDLDFGGLDNTLDFEGLTMSLGVGLPVSYEDGMRQFMGAEGGYKPWFEGMENMGPDGGLYPP